MDFKWGDRSQGINKQARDKFLKALSNFQKDIEKTNTPEKEFEKLGKFINAVFDKAFGVHYKFTYEDLKLEALEKGLPQPIEHKIVEFLNSVNEMEFDSGKITKENLMSCTEVLSGLVELLVDFKPSEGKAPQTGTGPELLGELESSEKSELEPLPELDTAALDKNEEISEEKTEQFEDFGQVQPEIEDSKTEKPDEEINDMFGSPEQMPAQTQNAPKKGFFSRLFKKKESEPEPPEKNDEFDLPAFPHTDEFKPPAYPEEEPAGKELIENKDILEVSEPAGIPVNSPAETFEVKDEGIVPVKAPVSKKLPAAQSKKTKPKKTKIPSPAKSLKTAKVQPPALVKPKAAKLSKRLPAKPIKPVLKAVTTVKKITAAPKVAVKHAIKKAKPLKPKARESPRARKLKAEIKTIKKISLPKEHKKELPHFEIPKKLIENEKAFQKDLHDVVKGLELGRKSVAAEIRLIDQEKKVLEKERSQIREHSDARKVLPEFKVFEKNINEEIKELEAKKKELLAKESQIDEKIKAVSVMEKNLKQLSKKLKKDEEDVKERTSFIENKEKIVKEIKKELEKMYSHAISEIESMKKELEDKRESFEKLQKFYQLRENRLSVEEGNLLQEKRQYAKLLSSLVARHFDIAKTDLEKTEKKIHKVKERSLRYDERYREIEKRSKGLVQDRAEIKKEIESKKKYFNELEEEFRSKDPQFEELSTHLDKRNDSILKKSAAISELQTDIEKTEEEIRARRQTLDLKELDLKGLEKQIERINYDLKNKNMKLEMKHKQLERRISSYTELRKEVMQHIAREKRAISRIEDKLENKGHQVTRKLNELDTAEKHYKSFDKGLAHVARHLKDDEELHINSITVTHGYPSVGNPAVLDILRLLNKSKDYLSNGDNDRAKDSYVEIQRIFEDLDEEERESIYPEILKVFRPKSSMAAEIVFTDSSINALLHQFQNSVDAGDMQIAEEVYNKLQEKYTTLPKDEKSKYYTRIMELYNRVLEQQVQTGQIVR
jgi:hypothetical protein